MASQLSPKSVTISLLISRVGWGGSEIQTLPKTSLDVQDRWLNEAELSAEVITKER